MKYTILLYFFSFVIMLSLCSCQNNTSNVQVGQAVSYPVVKTDSIKLDSLTKLISIDPDNAGNFEKRSVVYERMGKLTAALNDLDKALKIDSANVNYMVRLSDKYLQFGQSQVTRELLLKAVKIEPDNVEVLYRLGNLYFYVQDYKQAAGYLRDAKKADPYYAPSYFTYGMIYKERGDTANAIEQFQVAVEREPQYYDAYVMLGALFSGLHDSIAVDYYNNALKVLPSSYEAMYGIAYYYQTNNQLEKAIEQYNIMLEGNRDEFQHVYFNLGYIEMLFYAEYGTAIAYFDSALMIQPNYDAAYTNKGYCYEKLNKKESAIENYKKALTINPDREVAKLGLERLN